LAHFCRGGTNRKIGALPVFQIICKKITKGGGKRAPTKGEKNAGSKGVKFVSSATLSRITLRLVFLINFRLLISLILLLKNKTEQNAFCFVHSIGIHIIYQQHRLLKTLNKK